MLPIKILKNAKTKRFPQQGRNLGWKKSPSPRVSIFTLSLDQSTECCVQSFLEHLQGWSLLYLPGQSVPILNSPFWEEILPDVLAGPPLAENPAVSSHPAALHLGEVANLYPATLTFWVAAKSFSQAELHSLLHSWLLHLPTLGSTELWLAHDSSWLRFPPPPPAFP